MTYDELIAVIRAHAADLELVLDPADRAGYTSLRTAVATASEAERPRALGAFLRFLAERLPADHPVTAAIFEVDSPLSVAQQLDASTVAALFADLAEHHAGLSAANDVVARQRELIAEVTARLLAAPSYSPEEVRSQGADPTSRYLIRLTAGDGNVRLPVFQFGPDGQPRAIVVEANQMLLADVDPWGVADWWLSSNGWLGEAPADGLAYRSDEEIRRAARAVGSVR